MCMLQTGMGEKLIPSLLSDLVLPDIKSKEALFDDILEGDLSRLPALPSSTVRIFLSSTFSGEYQVLGR